MRQVSEDHISDLQHELRIGAVTARLLAIRGITDARRAEFFLSKRLQDLHRPEELLHMDVAAERFATALRERQRILIHGDFDVDGSTSATLLKLFCRVCSHDATVWIPHRVDDGYGLSDGSMQAVRDHQSQLMITVDCGICDHGWAQRIESEANCDVVITDHHLPQETLPQCTAVVNPNQPGCSYPDKGLAGVGVAWKLCWATACRLTGSEKLPSDLRAFLLDSLALVAIGTVADCAPLDNENRILVHHGLEALPKTENPGLKALLHHCRLGDRVSSDDIGWRIGPLLNASGRLSSALRNVDLLCADDNATATSLLDQVVQENDERRRLSQILTEDLMAEVEHHSVYKERLGLVFAGEGWHPGIVGIVASRLVERYGKPACVIAIEDGIGKGSLRTVPGVHLGEALQSCQDHILQGGGHAAAAGLSIREDQVDAFSEAFDAYLRSHNPIGFESPGIEVDCQASLADLDQDFFADLRRMGPFGVANPEPVLQLQSIAFVRPELFGRNGDHIRGAITDSGGGLKQILAWKAKDHYQQVSSPGRRFDVLVKPENNFWRGSWSSRLVLVDGRDT